MGTAKPDVNEPDVQSSQSSAGTNAHKIFLLGYDKTSGAVVCEEVELAKNEWPITYLKRRVAIEAGKKDLGLCVLMTIDASQIDSEKIREAFLLGLNSQAWVTQWGKSSH